MLSSISQYRLLIYYLQGLFKAHKKFPLRSHKTWLKAISCHIQEYRQSQMQSLLTLPNTISIPQKKKKKHCLFYSPIQTHSVKGSQLLGVCARAKRHFDLKTLLHIWADAHAHQNWVKYPNSQRTFQTTSLRVPCHHSQKPTPVGLF